MKIRIKKSQLKEAAPSNAIYMEFYNTGTNIFVDYTNTQLNVKDKKILLDHFLGLPEINDLLKKILNHVLDKYRIPYKNSDLEGSFIDLVRRHFGKKDNTFDVSIIGNTIRTNFEE